MAGQATTTDVEISFSVGDSFSTYDELKSKVKSYERVHFVQFWKPDACTIDAAKKRMDTYLKAELKYYELKFCCIHGGQVFKTKGKGSRLTS